MNQEEKAANPTMFSCRLHCEHLDSHAEFWEMEKPSGVGGLGHLPTDSQLSVAEAAPKGHNSLALPAAVQSDWSPGFRQTPRQTEVRLAGRHTKRQGTDMSTLLLPQLPKPPWTPEPSSDLINTLHLLWPDLVLSFL